MSGTAGAIDSGEEQLAKSTGFEVGAAPKDRQSFSGSDVPQGTGTSAAWTSVFKPPFLFWRYVHSSWGSKFPTSGAPEAHKRLMNKGISYVLQAK